MRRDVDAAACQLRWQLQTANDKRSGGGPNGDNVSYVAYGKITGGTSACPPAKTIVENDIFSTNGDSLIISGAFSRFVGGHRSGALLTVHAGGDIHNGTYQFQKQ